ncbi:hypothetical protein KJ641_03665 [Patescibacteria group bacterium]|nr:hypothetical protein [Patescibacteria group bacterium]MBU1895938.1 hypothetical protein [Patescibacteria group bacterium]
MINIFKVLSISSLLFIIGAGCGSLDYSTNIFDESTSNTDSNIQVEMQTLSFGGAITMEMPIGCRIDGVAGSSYIVCPTVESPTPSPSMVVSTDGLTVNIRRWEANSSDIWDHALDSLKILSPHDKELQINIEK